MLREIVALDASMTGREALRRLAQHGFWIHPREPEAEAWLEAYAARVHTLTGRAVSAADAARLLARPTTEGRTVIRRVDGVTVLWYAWPVDRLLRRLESTPEGRELTLTVCLDLHEADAAVAEQADALDDSDAERFVGVVLRGHEPMAVGEPPAPHAAPMPMPGPRVGGALRGVTRETQGIVPDAPPVGAAPDFSGEPEGDGGGDAHGGDAEEVHVRAYPRLAAPRVVEVDVPFAMVVSLADAPLTEVASGGALDLRAPAGTTTIAVDVQLVPADGIDVVGLARQVLDVRVDAPTEASITFQLVARAAAEDVRLTSLEVRFSVGGAARGWARRNIVVRAAGAAVPPPNHPNAQEWLDGDGAVAAMPLGPATSVPDVELDILKPDGNTARGSYRCVFRNAHGVPVSDAALSIELGDDAATFAKLFIDDVRSWSGDPIVDNLLQGNGDTIAKKLPPAFWAMLRAVADRVPGRPLTLQLNSAEQNVPWELALVDPPLDATRPPYLGAQVVMGRWLVGDTVAAPPKSAVTVRAMAVFAGMYSASSGLRALPKALEEAQALSASYATLPALAFECTSPNLKSLLEASLTSGLQHVGGVEAVHFAGHGEADPTHPGSSALYLSAGKPLQSMFFQRSVLGRAHAPFIFLNACMVGSAGEMLGDCAGFPGRCIAGGFSGVVAPLWSVNDDVAKAFALEFYQRTLVAGGGQPVAAVLRDLRAYYDAQQPTPTYLAYVFYGNPHLTLTRAASPAVA